MQVETQNEMMQGVKAGDNEALKRLFQWQYPFVCQTIRRFIADPFTVEDLAQEVFIRFWNKREQIDITSSLPAYLKRMAVNEALAHLRRQKHLETELTDNTPSPVAASGDEQLFHAELKSEVTAAIESLPPKCRVIFEMSRYEEMSYNEIAQSLDLSVKTVENQMGKALKLLRIRLQSFLRILI